MKIKHLSSITELKNIYTHIACLAPSIHCNMGRCVDNSEVCDGIKKCPDNEDEINCGKETLNTP